MSDNFSFEDALERLGVIADALDSDKLPLDEAVKLYLEGVELTEKCREKIENARLRISVLEQGGERVLGDDE